MKIHIEGVKDNVTLDSTSLVDAGGEGEIHQLPPDMLVKVYHDDQLSSLRQEKVLEFCTKYETYRGLFSKKHYAFPQIPANKSDDNEIVGFMMSNLGTHYPKLDSIGYEQDDFRKMPNGQSLTDDAAIKLIYDLYESLHKIHTAQFVFGDLNPSNIGYNYDAHKPIFFDFDSAQFGKYGCPAFSESYLDPFVEESGKTADGYFKYSVMSDCFAMAVIAYQLFVGAKPYAYRTNPSMKESERKTKRLALIGCLEDKNYLQRMGNISLIEHPQNAIRLERLRLLKQKNEVLYKYLFDTLVIGKRENLLYRLPKTDKRNPVYVFHTKEKVKTISDILKDGVQQPLESTWKIGPPIIALPPNTTIFGPEVLASIEQELNRRGEAVRQQHIRRMTSTKDPDMFKLFVANLGIDYSTIIIRGSQPNA
ncbi:MAG: hypothetical protein PHI31_10085 [Desulfuromonadaceae bacterium]|nr:hypothetical protein [Desulfuromonadaceae bacterium]